jgi:hypothetical protein
MWFSRWYGNRKQLYDKPTYGDGPVSKQGLPYAAHRLSRNEKLEKCMRRHRSFFYSRDGRDEADLNRSNKYIKWEEDMKKKMDQDWKMAQDMAQRDLNTIREEKLQELKSMREDMLKKWLENDPYDAMFGWSNRLRRGFGLSRFSEEMFKEVQAWDEKRTSLLSKYRDMTGTTASEAPPPKSMKSEESSMEVPREEIKKDEAVEVSPSEAKETNVSSPIPSTVKTEAVRDDALLEYDPITNRMVRKSDKAFSHYGQDLDTENDIPVKPTKSKASTTIKLDSPSVADVTMELRQFKAHRLSDQEVQSQAEGSTKATVQSPQVDREKLEKSFEKLHSSKGSIVTESLGPATKPQSSISEAPKVESNSTVQDLTDLSTRIINLGSRVSKLRDSFFDKTNETEMLKKTKAVTSDSSNNPSSRTEEVIALGSPSEKPVVPESQMPQSTPAANFRQLLKDEKKAEEVAKTSDPGYVSKVRNANLRRRLQIERMQGEIADLDSALENLGPGSLRFDLTRQRNELVRLTEELKKQIEPIYPYRNWDQGRERLQPQPIPKEDVFPMLFGEKRTKAADAVTKSEKTTEQLETEIREQKDAMKLAEELKPEPQNQRLNDTELVETIRGIYEERYGKITADNATKESINSAPVSAEAPASTTAISTSSAQLNDLPEVPVLKPQQEVNTSSTPATDPQVNATYTILAYDPSTSEVSTTTISAPISASDSPVPITVALTQLGEPAKFLPHLRLMGNHGSAVSVTKNLLVLRTTAADIADAQAAARPKASNSTREVGATRSNGSVNSDDSTFEDPYSDSWKGNAPRRVETVFSGRARNERWDRNEEPRSGRYWKRWFKRLGIASGVGVGILYVGGVTAGLRRVDVPKEER